MTILEENFKWHLEAFASEVFMYSKTSSTISQGQVSIVEETPIYELCLCCIVTLIIGQGLAALCMVVI